MATFVSLVTCHHCPAVTSRRGLIYRDSLSALSRNLRAPRGRRRPPNTRLQGPELHNKQPCTDARAELPEFIAVTRCRSSGMKHLVLTHLRKLLMLSPAHLPV